MENKTPFMTEIPEQEPQRQQYFMAHAKEQLHILEENLGRPLTCCINTFGCQMNARDSEKLLGILETIGYQAVETEDADFVLYNTCTVRENANLRVYGRLGQLGARKKKHPHMMIALCGCMMQEKEVVEKIKKTYRFVDLIFGTHNIFKLAELVSICLEERLEELEAQGREDKKPKHKMVVDVWKDTDQIVEDLPVERKYSFKSGVNIMFGCNNFCSYCIVPYVRGRERSRRPGEIIGEIKNLVEDGVVEVMLLGQNVNSYGKGLDEPLNFAQLLEEYPAENVCAPRLALRYSHYLGTHADLMPGAEAFLRRLHGQMKIVLVSNGDSVIQRNRLFRCVFTPLLDNIVISSEKGVSKPDPRLIEIALAECGCTDKAEAVMVGDSATADIPAAVNAGIDSIFVDWKNTGCQQATYTAKNLAEVEQILLKS